MYYSLISIALGSVFGAWTRWFVGLKLNSIYPDIPLGTVAVNLVGGFIIGFFPLALPVWTPPVSYGFSS